MKHHHKIFWQRQLKAAIVAGCIAVPMMIYTDKVIVSFLIWFVLTGLISWIIFFDEFDLW